MPVVQPLNIVHAFCHERGSVLGAIDTPDKSNEITVLPELLRMLEIKGCVVTLDAMGCQKKVAAQIIDQKGDYLISLKGNQGHLHEAVVDFFDAHEATDADFREPDFVADVFEYEEKSHGRHYRRRVVVTADFCGGLEPYKKHWKGLKTVVWLESWRTEKGKTLHGSEKAMPPRTSGSSGGFVSTSPDMHEIVGQTPQRAAHPAQLRHGRRVPPRYP